MSLQIGAAVRDGTAAGLRFLDQMLFIDDKTTADGIIGFAVNRLSPASAVMRMPFSCREQVVGWKFMR
ncbi:hypothetical protein ACNKHO_17495 [Shigella flexneri]